MRLFSLFASMSLCWSALATDPDHGPIRASLNRPLPKAHEAALELLDHALDHESEAENIELWNIILEHVENRADDIVKLSVTKRAAFYTILVRLFRSNRHVGVPGILQLMEILDEEENFAQLLFGSDFEQTADEIDYWLEHENPAESTILDSVLLLLNYANRLEDKLPRILPWIQRALAADELQTAASASLIVRNILAEGVEKEELQSLREAYFSFVHRFADEEQAVLQTPMILERFALIASTSTLVIGANPELAKLLSAIYRTRDKRQLSVPDNTHWMNALNLASGRIKAEREVDLTLLAREELDRILRLLKEQAHQPDKKLNGESYRTLADTAAVSLVRLRPEADGLSPLQLKQDLADAQNYLGQLVHPRHPSIFAHTVVKRLVSYPNTDALIRSSPRCQDLLTGQK